MGDKSKLSWYAMRVTYCRELKIKERLEEDWNMRCFVPMIYEKSKSGEYEDNEKKEVPAIHNLLFVYTSWELMKKIKALPEYSEQIRFIMGSERKTPIVINDKAMADFIRVSESRLEETLYLAPEEMRLKKGDKVRIKSGIWEGIVGKFVRIKKGLRVIVEIDGLMAVATTSMPPNMVEKI